MRLIDADATLELLRSLGSRDYRREKGTIMDAMKMIAYPEYTPTVDANPVVHGRWEWITEDIYGCTNCGATNHVKEVMGQPDYPYCPNCGAKMDGDGNG